jgi:hypothetical protein
LNAEAGFSSDTFACFSARNFSYASCSNSGVIVSASAYSSPFGLNLLVVVGCEVFSCCSFGCSPSGLAPSCFPSSGLASPSFTVDFSSVLVPTFLPSKPSYLSLSYIIYAICKLS